MIQCRKPKYVFLLLAIAASLALLVDTKPVHAHSPTKFAAQPYYGGHGVFRRWIDGTHYGIDFIMNWEPVLSAAGGSVEIAGWFNPNCHDKGQPGCGSTLTSGFGLYMRVNHGPTDHPYRTYYGHLSVVRTGMTNISQGQWLGTSGNSGYSDAPHLHFEIRHGGTAQANAVNPDNEGEVSLWTSGEWSGNNPANSKAIKRFVTLGTYGSEIVIDDTPDNTGGFTASCSTFPNCSGWNRITTAGYSGDMYWVYDNDGTGNYWAEWRPSLPQTADYRVLAYVPCTNAETWQAPYSISDGSNVTSIIVDQLTLCNQWIELGVVTLPAGTNSYVRLTNATQETLGIRKVGIDAVKFVRVNIGGFQAEDFRKRVTRSGLQWTESTNAGGWTGDGYMIVSTTGHTINSNIETTSPDMKYNLIFPTAGRYYIWIRGHGNNTSDDEIHAGLENTVPASAKNMTCGAWSTSTWTWCKTKASGGAAYLDINAPGFYTFNLFMSEDGFRADKMILTKDANYNAQTTPTNDEPYIFPGDDTSEEP